MCCGVVVHHCGKLVSILVLIEWSTLSRSELTNDILTCSASNLRVCDIWKVVISRFVLTCLSLLICDITLLSQSTWSTLHDLETFN